MNESKNANPTIVARETLKQLATLKIPPTPDNYYKLYNQIAGVSDNSVEANSLPLQIRLLIILIRILEML